MKHLALVLVASVVVVPAPLAATASPSVRVASTEPLTVSGRNFAPRERVRVVVVAKRRGTAVALAGRRGRFVVRFAFAVGQCTALRVAARGNRGSRATYSVIPECAPARAG